MDVNEEQLRQVDDKNRSDAYVRWSTKSEVKLLISMLPALQTDIQRVCFTTILRSAFDAGHDNGVGAAAKSFLNSMLANPRNDPRRG